MSTIRFLWHCFLFYRSTQSNGVTYFAVESHGIPMVTCMIGKGRAAWVVSDFAINFNKGYVK